MKKPSLKRQRFCEEYLIDMNGTQAAIRSGYSPNGASSAAERLLRNVEVRCYLDKLRADSAQRCAVNTDNVLRALAQIAFADIRSIYDDSGNLIDIQALGDDTAAAIAGVDVLILNEGGVERTVKKIRMNDRLKALELLSRFLGLFEKDNRQSRPFEHLSDAELLARVEEMEKKVMGRDRSTA